MLSKKKCFFPIVGNIFDQASDLGFICGLFTLVLYQSTKDSDCSRNELNAFYLFLTSLTFFLLYRIVSGILVLLGTKNFKFAIGQFFVEYMLYRAVWVNYKMKCNEPCSAQRWLQNMEAMLEAFPQMVLQIYFLIITDAFQGFVIFSITFSMISMVNKAVSEDKPLFNKKIRFYEKEFQEAQWKCKARFVNPRYIFRLFFRIFDISSRMILIVLSWIEIGGIFVIIVGSIEFVFLITVAIIAHEFSV